MKKALGAMAVAVALVGCGGSSSPAKLTIRGTFVLTVTDSTDMSGDITSCSGTGGYSDFQAGMNVTVKDGKGNIVGVGSAENLSSDDLDLESDAAPVFKLAAVDALSKKFTACYLKFTVPIKKADFYAVSVGKRGELSYSYDDLKSRDFTVGLTLGG